MNLKTFTSLVVAASLGLAAVWVGRQLIFGQPVAAMPNAPMTEVVKGQMMFEGLLAGQGVDGGLTALVPHGMRAVSVEVSESSGLAGLLVPGCRVDVIATLKQDNSQIAKTIVENAKVQAIG